MQLYTPLLSHNLIHTKMSTVFNFEVGMHLHFTQILKFNSWGAPSRCRWQAGKMTHIFKNGFLYGQCSTSCGLGAVWRTLTCSTGSESNCDPTKKPAPARQCYLRPCSMWKLGEWSMVRLLVNIWMFYMTGQYVVPWMVFLQTQHQLFRSQMYKSQSNYCRTDVCQCAT